MCSRRVNRDRARKREADPSHWCQPPSRRSYRGLPESIDLLWTQGPRPTGEALRNQHCAVPSVFTEQPYRDHRHSLVPLDCVKDPTEHAQPCLQSSNITMPNTHTQKPKQNKTKKSSTHNEPLSLNFLRQQMGISLRLRETLGR